MIFTFVHSIKYLLLSYLSTSLRLSLIDQVLISGVHKYIVHGVIPSCPIV